MRPVCEADIGGGAWRVKFHPSDIAGRAREVLVAGMHAGCRVVRFERGVMGGEHGHGHGDENGHEGDGWRIVRTFEKHESMVYGVDWSYKGVHSHSSLGAGAGETVIGSCSFYDHVLHLWRG
jgi:diphthamide biosynthesis protein 7